MKGVWDVDVIGRTLRFATGGLLLASVTVDHAVSDRRSAITTVHGSLTGDNVLAFVHYSRDGRPVPWEARALAFAKRAGLCVCVVTNLDAGVECPVAMWTDCADVVIERANTGRDLAAFRDAIRYLVRAGYRGPIALANDSVIWREDAHADLASRAAVIGAQVVGATSSLEPFPHLQTPWIWLSGTVSPAQLMRLSGLWRNVRTHGAAITYGELPFTHAATELGLSTGAIFPYEAVLAALLREDGGHGVPQDTRKRRHRVIGAATNGIALNPTHFMWSELLALGYPGIKRDLLRTNPVAIDDYFRIRPVAAEFGFDPDDLPVAPNRRNLLSRIQERVVL